jgi:uncharacterized protein (TIRG00374 family)
MTKYIKFIKVLISLGILVCLIRLIDFNVLWEQFSELNLVIFVFAFLILFIQCVLSSLKWKIILTAESKEVPFLFLLKIYLTGNFISLFLPSSFGGDIYRVYALKEYSKNYLQNTSSVLFDRISGLFALVSISIISFTLFYKEIISYQFFIVYALGILSFLGLTSSKFITKLQRSNKKFVRFFNNILESFQKYRKNVRVLVLSLIISFWFQINIVILNKLYCFALNIDLSITYLFMVIPLIYLTEALPISINGLGVREGAFIFFFTQTGVSNEEAFAVGLLVISMRYIFIMLMGGSLVIKEMLASKSTKKWKSTAVS